MKYEVSFRPLRAPFESGPLPPYRWLGEFSDLAAARDAIRGEPLDRRRVYEVRSERRFEYWIARDDRGPTLLPKKAGGTWERGRKFEDHFHLYLRFSDRASSLASAALLRTVGEEFAERWIWEGAVAAFEARARGNLGPTISMPRPTLRNEREFESLLAAYVIPRGDSRKEVTERGAWLRVFFATIRSRYGVIESQYRAVREAVGDTLYYDLPGGEESERSTEVVAG